MRKLILYILVIVSAVLTPSERSDVGKLIPVELVFIYKEDSTIVIETETGDKGNGNTVEEAITDLHQCAAGLIFLDTAQYLLISRECVDQLEVMGRYLKDNTLVCMAEPGIDLEWMARYLTVHPPKTSLGNTKTQGIAAKTKEAN